MLVCTCLKRTGCSRSQYVVSHSSFHKSPGKREEEGKGKEGDELRERQREREGGGRKRNGRRRGEGEGERERGKRKRIKGMQTPSNDTSKHKQYKDTYIQI